MRHRPRCGTALTAKRSDRAGAAAWLLIHQAGIGPELCEHPAAVGHGSQKSHLQAAASWLCRPALVERVLGRP
jgi:hypothetical protein